MKQFMQAFIERIDIFSERREDGNWIQNIKFQFPVPIIKEGKEVAQIKGISLVITETIIILFVSGMGNFICSITIVL